MGLIVFIAVLLIVIAIHEMGHYLACRALRIPVDEFAIGMGSKVAGFAAMGTRWNLRILPIGGFIKPQEEVLRLAAPWKKFVVAIAGPAANLLPFIGVAIYFKGIWATTKVFAAVYWLSMKSLFGLLLSPFLWLWGLINPVIEAAPKVAEKATSETVGLIGLGQASLVAADRLNLAIMMFIVLSISLGVVNLMPIVPLDGGRIVVAGVEQVAGRKRAERFQDAVGVVGVILILLLIVITTLRDILGLFG